MDLAADVVGLVPGVPSAAVKGAVKVVGNLDNVADAAKAATKAATKAAKAAAKIDAHHPLPKFLGGFWKQALEKVDSKVHTEYHSLLRENLKKEGLPLNVGGKGGSIADWATYLQKNPGAQNKAFDAVLKTARSIDAKYGTNITQAVWNSIMNNQFKSY